MIMKTNQFQNADLTRVRKGWVRVERGEEVRSTRSLPFNSEPAGLIELLG